MKLSTLSEFSITPCALVLGMGTAELYKAGMDALVLPLALILAAALLAWALTYSVLHDRYRRKLAIRLAEGEPNT